MDSSSARFDTAAADDDECEDCPCRNCADDKKNVVATGSTFADCSDIVADSTADEAASILLLLLLLLQAVVLRIAIGDQWYDDSVLLRVDRCRHWIENPTGGRALSERVASVRSTDRQ